MYLAENIYSPEDPKFKYLCGMKPTQSGNNFGPLLFRCRQVLPYNACIYIKPVRVPIYLYIV